jgi:hypothetical protein
MKTALKFTLVLLVGLHCLVTSAVAAGRTTVQLIKPNLIYVDGKPVSEKELKERLSRPGAKFVIELDGEMQVATLKALDRALRDSQVSDIEIKGRGRWVLDAVLEQRSVQDQ